MKKTLLLGALITTAIIVLASFTSIASAQSTVAERISKLQQFRNSNANGPWYPGYFILWIIYVIWTFLFDLFLSIVFPPQPDGLSAL